MNSEEILRCAQDDGRKMVETLRIGWIGFHVEGHLALQAVLEQGYRLEAVVTLAEQPLA